MSAMEKHSSHYLLKGRKEFEDKGHGQSHSRPGRDTRNEFVGAWGFFFLESGGVGVIYIHRIKLSS